MNVYCPSCGRQIPSDGRLCPYCGKQINQSQINEQAYTTPVKQDQKNNTLIIIIAVVIAAIIIIPIAIAAITYVYVSGEISPAAESVPNIQFVRDNNAKTLTVAAVDPSDIRWSELYITGNYNTPYSNAYITPGDTIYNCSGIISIRYIPTNTLIGTWEFI